MWWLSQKKIRDCFLKKRWGISSASKAANNETKKDTYTLGNYLEFLFYFLKIYLLIMLLQLSPFTPFTPLHPAHPFPPTLPPYSSCPWVILTSSLASTFPILFLPSPCLFSYPCLFSTYHLCYLFSVPFPPSPPPTPLLITLHVSSISVVPFLF